MSIKKLIEEMHSGELFLRNRTQDKAPLNDFDIEAFMDISAIMNEAIAEFEKQIPKKPVMIALDGFGFVQSSAVSCPTCGAAVINYYNRKFNPPHCIMCGQALDWGNTEKGGAEE